MADYDKFVEDSQYVAALKDRNKAYADVERFIRRVKKLADRPPAAKTYEDLRLETKKALDILDEKEKICLDLIAENCEDYTDNDDYNESIDSYDTDVLDWNDLLSKEYDRIYGPSTPVKADENSSSIAEMVSLIKDQSAQ